MRKNEAVTPTPDSVLEMKTPPNREYRDETSLLHDVLMLLLKVVIIAGIAALMLTFVYGLHRNADPDMRPVVKDGDLVMFVRLDKDYVAGDMLMLTFQGQRQVRRVVATAGDTVDISEYGLLINGALQQEPGIGGRTERYIEGIDFPVTLGEDEVFVLGDARTGATDSRVYGTVNVNDTLGTVIVVIKWRNL